MKIKNLISFLAIFFMTFYFYASDWSRNLLLMESEFAPTLDFTVQIVFFITVGLFALGIWFNRDKFLLAGRSKQIITLGVLLIILILSLMSQQRALLILAGIFVMAMCDKQIMKYILLSNIPFFILTNILGLTGVLTSGNRLKTSALIGGEGVFEVNALGFSHANTISVFLFAIVASAQYFILKKKIIWMFLLVFASSIIISISSGSSGGLITFAIFHILLIFRSILNSRKILSKIASYIFLFGTILTFVIAILFGMPNTLPNNVNDGLTGRPRLWALRIENNSFINLAGDNDEYNVSKYVDGQLEFEHSYPLDNTPLYMLVHYGIIVYVLYAFLYFKAGKVIKDDVILIIGIATLVAMINEQMIYNVYTIFAVKYVLNHYLTGGRKML